MDPFSITVGILTIIGAAGAAVKLADKIAAISHALEITRALREEVDMVQGQVKEAHALLRMAQSWNLPIPESLTAALQALQETIAELDGVIDRCLERQRTGLSHLWCFYFQRQLETLLGRIQRHRTAVNDAKTTLSIGLELTMHSNHQNSGLGLAMMMFLIYKAMHHGFDRMEMLYQQGRPSQILVDTPAAPAQISHGEESQDPGYTSEPEYHHVPPTSASETISSDATAETCPPHCACCCHTSNTFQTPSFLSSVVGRLSIGYNTPLWQNRACNENYCKQTSNQPIILYAFPTWLWQTIFVCTMRGPDLSLRRMNVRDPSWRFQGLVMSNNQEMAVRETKRQLVEGELSVRDVTPNWATALHLAMYSHLLAVSKILVTKGADIHYKDRYGRSPYMIAWERHWTRQRSRNDGLAPNFFADKSHFVDFKFTELHQAYLGITKSDFYELVSKVPRQYIDRCDRQGRTTLSWAAGRNDAKAVRKLLDSRADPEKASIDGWTPLHYAAEADGTEALEMLLDVKVIVDSQTNTGRTPLHVACANSRVPKMMELLMARGADINKRAKNGFTPLEHTFVHGTVTMTQTLLDAGARCGLEMVNWAICHNSHEALALLLTRWHDKDFDHDDADDDDDTFHYVVHYVSLSTLEVLTAMWPTSVDLSSRTETGRSTQEDAVWRRDHNVEWSREYTQAPDKDPVAWYIAFDGLIQAIQTRQLNSGTPMGSDEDDLAEDYYSSEESSSLLPDEDEHGI